MSRRVYAGRKDVLAKGVPKPLFVFAGVAIGMTSFIVLRVVLNPWGVNPSGAETQRVFSYDGNIWTHDHIAELRSDGPEEARNGRCEHHVARSANGAVPGSGHCCVVGGQRAVSQPIRCVSLLKYTHVFIIMLIAASRNRGIRRVQGVGSSERGARPAPSGPC